MTAATAATITTATAVVIRMSGSVMAERLSGVVPVLVGGGAEFAGVAVAGGMERVVPGVAVLRVGVRFGVLYAIRFLSRPRESREPVWGANALRCGRTPIDSARLTQALCW